MRANLDHDIFAKKGKSEPTQIPFGQSGISLKNEYKTSQQNMRDIMTQSISLNRPVLGKVEKALTADQKRIKFNFDAKHKAALAGKNTFTGKCLKHGLTEFKFYLSGKHHCVECRKIIIQRKKEAMV